MSARSRQWVEVQLVTTRRIKVLVNVVTPDDLESMSAGEILEESLGTWAKGPIDSIVIVGSCDEPKEWL